VCSSNLTSRLRSTTLFIEKFLLVNRSYTVGRWEINEKLRNFIYFLL
jgi:hypothetical protein